jgi:hypothetical protein
MGGSDIGLLSVISGFLPAYYRFWDESLSASTTPVIPWSVSASATPVFRRWMCWNVLRENFDDQITPNNTKNFGVAAVRA